MANIPQAVTVLQTASPRNGLINGITYPAAPPAVIPYEGVVARKEEVESPILTISKVVNVVYAVLCMGKLVDYSGRIENVALKDVVHHQNVQYRSGSVRLVVSEHEFVQETVGNLSETKQSVGAIVERVKERVYHNLHIYRQNPL